MRYLRSGSTFISSPLPFCFDSLFAKMASRKSLRRSERLRACPSEQSVSISHAGRSVNKRRRTTEEKAPSHAPQALPTTEIIEERGGNTFPNGTQPCAPQLTELNKAVLNSTLSSTSEANENNKNRVSAKADIYPVHHAKLPTDKLKCGHSALRLVTWNVTSIRSVMRNGALAEYVSSDRPHILCVQETKLSSATEEQFNGLPDYDVYWYHSERKGYSGVAAFVRQDGPVVEQVTRGIGDATADAEGRVLSLFLKCGICIVCAYVPNAGGKLSRLPYRTETFEPALRNFLADQAAKGSVVYCGDLNVAYEEIDIHNSKGNTKSAGHTPQEREQFGILLQHGPTWVDCYRNLYPSHPGYTYFSRRFGSRSQEQGKGWRLDYFLLDKATHAKNPVIDCFVRPHIVGSDHYPLVLDFDLSRLSTNL